jgi:hypothetical protein
MIPKVDTDTSNANSEQDTGMYKKEYLNKEY